MTGTHQWYDGTPHPWEFKRVWQLKPSPTDPDTVYAGVEDAALFRSSDGGHTWFELAALRTHSTGQDWAPGVGGMCLHTILIDPQRLNFNETANAIRFSALMLSFSQGNLLLALILLLLASLVLVLGLPVTASYIVLIVLAGPALVNEFGLPVLTAHLVVFWFSQDSNVTPLSAWPPMRLPVWPDPIP